MVARIKSASAIDSSKTTTVSYCDCNRSLPVKLVGIASSDLTGNNDLLIHIHSRIASIVKAFDKNNDDLTELTLEMAS